MCVLFLCAGAIFHVRVHTPQKGLEHALLYSIGVNLPAHRVGQLDRVLVLASPINDINIYAWDLNRVKHFMRLDIGIQMELCGSCITSSLQGTSITFILDKVFHEECIDFLCHEARIGNRLVSDNSLLVYPVDHTCARGASPAPPSYLESQRHLPQGERADFAPAPPDLPPRNIYATREDGSMHMNGACRNGSPQTFSPAVPGKTPGKSDFVPPRNITRRNFESAMPAVAHPYMNFQPQLFQQSGSSSFDSPYQISSRIIITNSGEVQYERNILGNKPQHHGGFHFKTTMPLPPRSTNPSPNPPKVITPNYRINRSPNRTTSLPVSHERREQQRANRRLQKRASEISDSEGDDSYVFIPDVVYDPTRVPLPQTLDDYVPPPPLGEGLNLPSSTHSSDRRHSYENQYLSNEGLSGNNPPLEGPNFQDPSFEGLSGNSSSHYPSRAESNSRSSPFEASNFPDPSFQTSFAPAQPQSEGVAMFQHLSVGTTKEDEEGTDTFSSDYDDVVLLSQLRIRHGNGAVPQLVATQEIRSSDSLVPVPASNDYTLCPAQPSCDRPTSPNKPQVKPRRKKPLSESESLASDYPTSSPVPSTTQKSHTIPKMYAVNSDPVSQSPFNHHTFDLASQDGHSPSPVASVDTSLRPSHPPPHMLTHPPLTPPTPRPRPSFSRFGGGVHRTEDDSRVGMTSGDHTHNQRQRHLSTQLPITDL